MIPRPAGFLVFLLTVALGKVSAGPLEPVLSAAPAPTRWSLLSETAQIFSVNNVNDYHIAPQILSLGYRPDFHWWRGSWKVAPEILVSARGEAVLNGRKPLPRWHPPRSASLVTARRAVVALSQRRLRRGSGGQHRLPRRSRDRI